MHPLNNSTYRPEIDGLRALAVLSAVTFHISPDVLPGGFVGVDIFFVLSGFLITRNIFEDLNKHQFNFSDFFDRRIRRIFPALILVVSSSLTFGWFVLLNDEYSQLGKHAASGAAFISNFIFANESGYFDPPAETKPLLHLWSLAVEEQFYVIWPLVLWLAWKWGINLLSVTIIVGVVSFSLNIRLANHLPHEAFYWPFSRFWELLSGSAIAWVTVYRAEAAANLVARFDDCALRTIGAGYSSGETAITSNTLSALGLLFLLLSVIHINQALLFPSTWALMPVLGTALVIISGARAWPNRIIFMNPIAVWFGLISYPLYLWHWPVLSFLQIIEGESIDWSARVGAILLSITLAWLTFNYLEIPIRSASHRALKSGLLLLGVLSIGLAGAYIYKTNGITPHNSDFVNISSAKNDWSYPQGLVKTASLYSTSREPAQVLLFGDSYIQAYGPRVVNLYSTGLIKEVAFLTSGGCAPIPNSFRRSGAIEKCSKLFEELDYVLKSNPIETVIIGGSFGAYFNQNKDAFFISDDGSRLSLATEKGRNSAIESFYGLVKQLSMKYKVVVVSPTVASSNFDPSNMMMTNKRRSIPLSSSLINRPFVYDNRLEVEMATWLTPLSVTLVNQAENICPAGVCLPLTADGRPKYKDSTHLRPFYVIEFMDILDEHILLH